MKTVFDAPDGLLCRCNVLPQDGDRILASVSVTENGEVKVHNFELPPVQMLSLTARVASITRKMLACGDFD